MQYQKIFLSLIILLSTLTVDGQTSVLNDTGHRYLTSEDIQRVKAFKEILDGVDQKSLQETIDELEKTHYPQINLLIREAMAKTFADIVKDYNVVGQKKKKWLYSMVCLNMAYIQFGGGEGNSQNSTSLNRLICRKLKGYLPVNVLKQHGMIYSLE